MHGFWLEDHEAVQSFVASGASDRQADRLTLSRAERYLEDSRADRLRQSPYFDPIRLGDRRTDLTKDCRRDEQWPEKLVKKLRPTDLFEGDQRAGVGDDRL